ncbi:L-seryl-tRNA(Sec) selenium transferase [Engelhardtia mirabilis]|uniref:L-seryl-tRNA(Sec) selenium transferase n=1 Tax=Engelhardtia mirabilis TaxID=2528011 RepID=A0A518BIH4_9BACT|nr:L-seryl-tRNA(Sec) selenium transferase [Planctomycetes bacterium Pla133]QDV01090.1 L-seryl-tRNA(Sec) selenium transferase [Planctomycetes bacterium Pla86]
MPSAADNPYRALPSVDALAAEPALADLAGEFGPELVTRLIQGAVDRMRSQIRERDLDGSAVRARVDAGDLVRDVQAAVARERRAGVVPIVNATGVVLNTGLGRAPVHPEAAAAMAAVAGGYCVLEVDRESGKRNRRDDRVGELVGRLVGCEAAIAVNNCAAAVYLSLQTFAGARAAVLSRGELVEIGGSFRMPDVMSRAGVRLVEVGTTNRTRGADFERALDTEPDVAALLKVHTSNYRVVGFVEEVSPAQLAQIGAARGVTTIYDLGSGRLDAPGTASLDFLGDEPDVREAVASGVDVVLFSGDKLLGAPQAGILAGKAEAIGALRANPIYRAVRLDKVGLAGLEKTLELLLAGRGDELPARALLTASAAQIEPRARALAAELAGLPQLTAEVVGELSQPGSGSAPDVFLPTFCIRVVHEQHSAEALSRALRRGEPPVFARVHDDRVLLDPRTLLPGDDARLVQAFAILTGA